MFHEARAHGAYRAGVTVFTGQSVVRAQTPPPKPCGRRWPNKNKDPPQSKRAALCPAGDGGATPQRSGHRARCPGPRVGRRPPGASGEGGTRAPVARALRVLRGRPEGVGLPVVWHFRDLVLLLCLLGTDGGHVRGAADLSGTSETRTGGGGGGGVASPPSGPLSLPKGGRHRNRPERGMGEGGMRGKGTPQNNTHNARRTDHFEVLWHGVTFPRTSFWPASRPFSSPLRGGGDFVQELYRRGKSWRGKMSPPLQIPKLTLPHPHTALPTRMDFAGGKIPLPSLDTKFCRKIITVQKHPPPLHMRLHHCRGRFLHHHHPPTHPPDKGQRPGTVWATPRK